MREAVVLLLYQVLPAGSLQIAAGLWLALIVVCVLLATVLALVLLARWQKRGLEKHVDVEIVNQGNVATTYELRVEAPGAHLTTAFACDGRELSGRAYEEVMRQAAVAGPPVSLQAVPQAAAQPAYVARPAPASTAERTGQSVLGTAGRGIGVLGALAVVLGTVGSLLPTSMRGPVVSASMRLRAIASTGRRVMSVPNQLGSVRATATGGFRPDQPNATAGAGGHQGPAGLAPAPAPARGAEPPVSQSMTIERFWAETPLVQPGQTLALQLILRPLAAVAGRACAFTVFSRPSGQLDAAPQTATLTGEGLVQIGAQSWLGRYGPYLLVLLVAAAILVFAFWAVR